MRTDTTLRPGRTCPSRHRYGAGSIASLPEHAAATLYVVGGLYGNLPALDAVESMARDEPGPVTLCFNGDFNWFNVDDESFRAINERVFRHRFIAGNVEAELGSGGEDAGCGCAYPDSVDDGTVERSNRIHAALRGVATRHPDLLARLEESALAQRWRVGDLRIGVVHGDADALSGWRFDASRLGDPGERDWQATAFAAAEVDMFASSHTCQAAMRRLGHGEQWLVANNGAAGMPNFRGERCGLLTRIGLCASPHESLHAERLRGVHVDALAIRYDHAAWLEGFLANWPEGSPAWLSYFRRITEGPEHFRREAFPDA